MTTRLPSVMRHDFSKAPTVKHPRSSFDRSYGYKTTFNAGYLIPIHVDEVLPGDSHNLRSTLLIRAATFPYPLMDNIHIDVQSFFCPSRILQTNWVKLMGEQTNPGDSINYLCPVVTSTNSTDFGEGTIYDYMGVATKISGMSINSLPLRAYNKIHNQWYRSERLQSSVVDNMGDGPDNVSDYALLRRGKRYDYFTSCLDAPQAGASVTLPLGTSAPVLGIGKFNQNFGLTSQTVYESDGTTSVYPFAGVINPATNDNTWLVQGTAATGYPNIYADLSLATSATINTLRLSIATQQLQETDIRCGTRYQEVLWGHFQVDGGDARLQRPELLSTYSQLMSVNLVPQSSGSGITSQTTPQANLAGYGVSVTHKAGFIKSFVEHGYIITLMSARADLTYQNGTDRFWYRRARLDFYWPEFANLGEQAVLQREILTSGTNADTGVFGYIPFADDYRVKNSKITGLFRTNATGTLDSWHLSQDLSGGVALNSTFIVDNPPMTRVKATSGDPDFIADIFHNLISVRPLPMNSRPGLHRL